MTEHISITGELLVEQAKILLRGEDTKARLHKVSLVKHRVFDEIRMMGNPPEESG